MNPYSEKFFTGASLIAVIVGLWYITTLEPNVIVNIPEQEQIATTPSIDEPIEQPVPPDEIDYESIELLSTPYIPTQEVYTKNYLQESLKIALSGDFKLAEIVIGGEVLGEGDHFLSVNFEHVSGTLKAVRSNSKRLDVAKTKERGGVYTRGILINETIDLLGSTPLATTSEDFLSKKGIEKNVRFWDYLVLDTPTVARFLVAPFNNDGQYGGAVIKSITFRYQCLEEGSCDADICLSEEYARCLIDSFGIEAARNWCGRTAEGTCQGL